MVQVHVGNQVLFLVVLKVVSIGRSKARADVPGASFFELSEGQSWLNKLVIAVVFIFGIHCGVGSEKFDAKIKEKAANLSITPGGDETFFENIILLVCMDLNSGFIFNEEIPDLFHMMNAASKVMKFSFHRQKKSVEKQLKKVGCDIKQDIDIKENEVKRAALSNQLRRVEKQIPEVSLQVDMWWQWVHNSLEHADIQKDVKDWLVHYLLPLVYWKNCIPKTRSKIIKRMYKISRDVAEKRLDSHPLTSRLLKANNSQPEWLDWAQEMAKFFIRTTSAIEGRNG